MLTLSAGGAVAYPFFKNVIKMLKQLEELKLINVRRV
jgi:hypothetical protein